MHVGGLTQPTDDVKAPLLVVGHVAGGVAGILTFTVTNFSCVLFCFLFYFTLLLFLLFAFCV